ncbi:PREDICTED: lectin L6-like [Amphimedon queenslandica]|uniref:Uncharacterized protein n=1 Tax=Amphimedon queenslandica TaxID=400682 RepID=A0A1X7SK69_AMPQE|nr:PREDICTED: lectin L6-like [Amphimedon queenslandica]|eukprot:XP_011409280.1 PREDICTED: lectin L6-like [Amphimedon queenslandica]
MKAPFCCILVALLLAGMGNHAADATTAQWTKLYGTMSQVYANSVSLWSIDAQLKAYYCPRPCTGNWAHVGSSMVNIEVDAYYTWSIGADGYLYKKAMQNSGGWFKHTYWPRDMIDIASTRDSYMWFLHEDKSISWIKHYNPTVHKVTGKFDQIDANSQHVYALNKTTNVISFRPVHGRGQWRTIPGQMKYVTAGTHEIFAIGVDDELYRCTIPCAGIWEQMGSPALPASNVVQLDATIDALFAVTSAGGIYRHELPL